MQNALPSSYNPGTIGDFIYHPMQKGPFFRSITETIDSMTLMSMYDVKKKENKKFDEENGQYDQKREKYDKKVKQQK